MLCLIGVLRCPNHARSAPIQGINWPPLTSMTWPVM
jgi:hypothetical protein